MIAGYGAFAGIVIEVPHFCASIEAQDGIGRQRAKTHRRDVEDAGVIGLGALFANHDPEVSVFQCRRLEGMVDPLKTLVIHT